MTSDADSIPPDDISSTATGPELPDRLLSKLKLEVEGYQLLEKLGAGGQATVYRARRLKDDRIVAIKILHSGPHADEQARARLKRETNALMAMKHPNIVHAIAAGRTRSGLECLVMNYIDGRPLDALWEDSDFAAKVAPEPEARLRLFKRICEIVQCAHLKGITHRDLSPSNILVDTQGQPHILDFGMASTAFDGILGPGKNVTVTGQFIGKIKYASPEQARGAGSAHQSVDIRSDVYALGVVLYQLLTNGAFPYEVVGNVIDVLNNIIHSKPRRPSEILAGMKVSASPITSDEPASSSEVAQAIRRNPPLVNETIEAIVLKALEKHPKHRYQSAGELAVDIQRYLSGQPTSATVWSKPPNAASLSNHHRRFVIVTASMVLTAILIGVTMNAHKIAVWIGFTTAAIPAAIPELAPSAALVAAQSEGSERRLNTLAADLARVEARLHAVNRQLAGTTARKPLDLDANSAPATGPLPAEDFCSALGRSSQETGCKISFASLSKEDRDREEQAEADLIKHESNEEFLLNRRAELDAQQGALWARLAWETHTGREADKLFRYNLKASAINDARLNATNRVLKAGVKVRRLAESAMNDGTAALKGISGRAVSNKADLSAVMSDVAAQLRSTLSEFKDAAVKALDSGKLSEDDGKAVTELRKLAERLLDSLDGCTEYQGHASKARNEHARFAARGGIQRSFTEVADAAGRFDARLVQFAADTKAEIDLKSPLRKLESRRSPSTPAERPADDESVATLFAVGNTWELEGGLTATVQRMDGNQIVLVIQSMNATPRTLQLQVKDEELWLISDSSMGESVVPGSLEVRGVLRHGRLNLAGTRTVLVSGQRRIEPITYVFIRRAAMAVDAGLAAWKKGSEWINVASGEKTDNTWEVVGRAGKRIELARRANRGARDLVVTLELQPKGKVRVISVQLTDGSDVRDAGGSGDITGDSLALTYSWKVKRKKRNRWWPGSETLNLRPQ